MLIVYKNDFKFFIAYCFYDKNIEASCVHNMNLYLRNEFILYKNSYGRVCRIVNTNFKNSNKQYPK